VTARARTASDLICDITGPRISTATSTWPPRSAVITGAGSGFGLELARLGAKKGLNLVLTDVQQDALDEAVHELRSVGAKVAALRGDVSRPEDVQALADMLERIRTALGGKPLIITSGYRCRELNRAVGGVATSDHTLGCAADVVCPAYGTPYEVAKALAPQMARLGIGQLALEGIKGKSWIHLSSRTPARQADRVITITDAGTQLGIQPIA